MDKKSFFEGRKVIIATRHGKENVIGPALKKAFKMTYSTAAFDTDLLGTFSGEVERVLSPLEAAREKCRLALDEEGDADIAIASEGSFGPHPTFYFMPSDEEILLLVDRKNALEIAVKHTSLNTNFGSFSSDSEETKMSFFKRVKFPSHALIVKESDFIAKGIQTKEHLNRAINACFSLHGQYQIFTDMRAMYNPTRMAVIQEATDKLIQKMQSQCPGCCRPGFGITDALTGLLCSTCSMPTRSVKTVIYSCEGCHYTEKADFPDGKTEEDPMFCDFCNP
jgi:hypothetical protein